MTDFYDFGCTSDEVIEPAPEDPRIQWFHRRNFCDENGKTKGLTVGWHSQEGRDDAWDNACLEAGFRLIRLKQGDNLVSYWQIGSSRNGGNEDLWGSASPFILAKGCPSESEMMAAKTNRFGIAYGWGKNRAGSPRKIMKFRALLPEIYGKPVVFVVGGKGLVGCLLHALGRDGHYRVLRANNQRLQEQGLQTRTPYWGFRLALLPGDDITIKSANGNSDITSIITDIPNEITAEFLASHHVGDYRELVQNDIRENGYSIEWSLKVSQSIEVGTDETKDPNGDQGREDGPFEEAERHDTLGLDEDAAQLGRSPQSTNLNPLSDVQLRAIAGSANEAQRRALQKLGNLLLARKAGLSREEAAKAIASAQRR